MSTTPPINLDQPYFAAFKEKCRDNWDANSSKALAVGSVVFVVAVIGLQLYNGLPLYLAGAAVNLTYSVASSAVSYTFAAVKIVCSAGLNAGYAVVQFLMSQGFSGLFAAAKYCCNVVLAAFHWAGVAFVEEYTALFQVLASASQSAFHGVAPYLTAFLAKKVFVTGTSLWMLYHTCRVGRDTFRPKAAEAAELKAWARFKRSACEIRLVSISVTVGGGIKTGASWIGSGVSSAASTVKGWFPSSDTVKGWFASKETPEVVERPPETGGNPETSETNKPPIVGQDGGGDQQP